MTDEVQPQAPVLRRRNRTMGLLIAGVAVLAGAGIGVGIWAATSGLDRDDSKATAAAFATAYATGDPDTCEFATPELASHLTANGQCTGSATGQSPQVDVVFGQDCGSQSLAGLALNPPGAVGQHYALVGLTRSDEGFSARSIQPLSTLAGQQPGECTS